MSITARIIAGALLFVGGIISAYTLVSRSTDSVIIGYSIWFGSGVMMGAGVGLPFGRPRSGALFGALLMVLPILWLAYILRNGS